MRYFVPISFYFEEATGTGCRTQLKIIRYPHVRWPSNTYLANNDTSLQNGAIPEPVALSYPCAVGCSAPSFSQKRRERLAIYPAAHAQSIACIVGVRMHTPPAATGGIPGVPNIHLLLPLRRGIFRSVSFGVAAATGKIFRMPFRLACVSCAEIPTAPSTTLAKKGDPGDPHQNPMPQWDALLSLRRGITRPVSA